MNVHTSTYTIVSYLIQRYNKYYVEQHKITQSITLSLQAKIKLVHSQYVALKC